MKKKPKILYLSEETEEKLKEDWKITANILNEFKPDYKKFMKKIIKCNPQTRTFIAEALLRAIIHDLNMPVYYTLGMLDKIKSELIDQSVILTQEDMIKKIPSYTG